MKLTRTLDITSDEFYNYLEDQIWSEYIARKKGSKKDFSLERGMKYTYTHDKSNTKNEILIKDYVRGQRYHSKVKSAGDTLDLIYETKEDDGKLIITFTQNLESFDIKKKSVFSLFSEAVYYGRMSDALHRIQNEIVKLRENENQQI